MVNNWLNYAQSRLFPRRCWLCQRETDASSGLCTPCQADLPHNHTACPVCALPLTTAAELCGHCLNQPPFYDVTHTPYIYAKPLDRFITGLKFHRKLSAATLLGALLAEHLKTVTPLPECIVPIPLHPARLRQRGFNQAVELAKPLAKRLSLPIDRELCIRLRNTRAQSVLSFKQRGKNIKHAFALNNNCHYRHVAILDDVITTGNTVNELAMTLKKAGVERIQIWSVARAILHK